MIGIPLRYFVVCNDLKAINFRLNSHCMKGQSKKSPWGEKTKKKSWPNNKVSLCFRSRTAKERHNNRRKEKTAKQKTREEKNCIILDVCGLAMCVVLFFRGPRSFLSKITTTITFYYFYSIESKETKIKKFFFISS